MVYVFIAVRYLIYSTEYIAYDYGHSRLNGTYTGNVPLATLFQLNPSLAMKWTEICFFFFGVRF